MFSRQVKSQALVMTLALGTAGCIRGDAQEAAGVLECNPSEVVTTSSSEPIQLVVCILDPEVRVGDSIRVFVGLKNVSDGPVFTRARFDLGAFLLIRIENERGDQQDIFVGEPGHFDQSMTDIMLPRGGLIGRVLDLSCDQGGYRRADVRCFSELELSKPGLYRVFLSYAVLCGKEGCPEGHPWVGRLSAPPVSFRIQPGP